MRARTARQVTLIGLAVAAACCGRQGFDEPALEVEVDAGLAVRVPERHRASGTCEKAVRPAPESCAKGPEQLSTCDADDECTAGRNGRCTNGRFGCHCVYDACVSDDECGAGQACACNPFGSGNRCVKAGCRVDQDCGTGGFCGPQLFGCTLEIGAYQCYTSRDQCIADSDCGGPYSCRAEPGETHRRCHGPIICRG
jgi:hypothetical protein